MLTVRPATFADTKVILEIYIPYVLNTAITFENDVPQETTFQKRITDTLKNYPYLVAENNGRVVGFTYASSYSKRSAYKWTAEVSIYVATNTRGLGIGHKLYSELEKILKKQNVVNLTACITSDNSNSVSFHEKLGYQISGTLKHFGYKLGKWHDITWMQKRISDLKEPVEFVPYSKLK